MQRRPFVEVIVFEGNRPLKVTRVYNHRDARGAVELASEYVIAHTSDGCFTITTELGLPLKVSRAQLLQSRL